MLETLDRASIHIIIFKKRTTKVPIRLRGCAGWSAPLLFVYCIRHIFAWPGPSDSWWQEISRRHLWKVPTSSGSRYTITHKVHSGNAEQCRRRTLACLSTYTPGKRTDPILYVAVHAKPEEPCFDKLIVTVTTPMSLVAIQGFEYEYNASYPLWDKRLLIIFTLYNS